MTTATTTDNASARDISGPVSSHVKLAASAIIVLCAWGSLLLLIWNLDRGFDLTDESFLLYLYRHPDAFLDRLYFQYFRLVRALIPPSLDHILFYRLLKLIGLIAFTGLFSAVFVKWITRRFGVLAKYSLHPIILFHFLLIGSFLAYCHGSQTLSYNDLVTFILLGSSTACFALDLAPSRMHPMLWRFLISLFIGGFLVLLVPVKWTSAVLLFAYYLAFSCFVAADRRISTLFASLGGALVGAAAVVFAISDAGIGEVVLFTQFFQVFRLSENLGSHVNILEILKSYRRSVVLRVIELFHFPAVVAALLLPMATIVMSGLSRYRTVSRRALGILVVATLLSLAAFASQLPNWAWRHQHWFHRSHVAELQTFAFVFAWIAACASLPLVRENFPRRDLIAFISAAALIATLPAVASIGTDNALLTQFIRHMAPLFAALAVTAAFLGLVGRWRPFASVVCATVAGLTAAQLAFVVLLYPYRLPQSGISQSNLLAEPPHIAGLKVDLPTKTFIESLLTEARRAVGDTTGMRMLALFDIPGVVYLLDGIAVGFPWHSSNPNFEHVVCYRIRTDPLSRTRPRLIALDRDRISSAMLECLSRAGIDLATYSEIARIPNPYAGQRPLRLLTTSTENP